ALLAAFLARAIGSPFEAEQRMAQQFLDVGRRHGCCAATRRERVQASSGDADEDRVVAPVLDDVRSSAHDELRGGRRRLTRLAGSVPARAGPKRRTLLATTAHRHLPLWSRRFGANDDLEADPSPDRYAGVTATSRNAGVSNRAGSRARVL